MLETDGKVIISAFVTLAFAAILTFLVLRPLGVDSDFLKVMVRRGERRFGRPHAGGQPNVSSQSLALPRHVLAAVRAACRLRWSAVALNAGLSRQSPVPAIVHVGTLV
jgi:hypothetical protein